MPKRIGGSRRKTRGKFSLHPKQKGKPKLRNYLATYKPGDQVVLKIDPTVAEGMFHARFMGRAGTVKAKRGACYEVAIVDINVPKTLIVHPVHLRRC